VYYQHPTATKQEKLDHEKKTETKQNKTNNHQIYICNNNKTKIKHKKGKDEK